MKRIAIGMFACWALVSASAEDLAWLTDLSKAQEQAKAENKLVLLDFTGSDWCGWCIKFDKEVLSTPEFAGYANKNLVLVEVDFPRRKKLDSKLEAANLALQKKYDVKGYPTFVILNGGGKEVGRQVGYTAGGPKTFIVKLERMKNE